ncbi:MAG: PASTA domain-containing protein, partial [Micromonosporaceae bacterium]
AAAGAMGAASPAGATPGGTSVMPAVGPATGQGAPAGQGGFARGAASVPTPAQEEESYYGYAGGGAGGYGGPPEPPRKKRGGLILGIAGAVLLLLLGVGLIAFLLNGQEKEPTGGGTPTASAAAEKVTIDQRAYLGKNADEVEKDLKAKGLKVDREERKKANFQAGTVNGVEPDGEVDKGSTVTIYVQPKSGLGDLPTLPGAPNDNPTGDHTQPGDPGTTQPSDDETTDEPSDGPSPSASGGLGGFNGPDTEKDE